MAQYKDRIKVNINGKEYESIQDASMKLGIHHTTIGRWVRKIKESCRSEIDFTVKLPAVFTVKKIKK